jgi:hypothetical protein
MAFPLCPSTAGLMKLSDVLMHTSNNILRMISQAELLPLWSPGDNGRLRKLGVITSQYICDPSSIFYTVKGRYRTRHDIKVKSPTF